jgi:hypothetical protein
MIRTAYAIAERIWYKPRLPEVDLKYRQFIRRFPCVACKKTTWRIEFAHTGPRGLGQKADDKDGLPICVSCHQTGTHSLHKIGPVAFQEHYKIEFPELIQMFRSWYENGVTE